MKILSFKVPGEPKGKGRPRFSVRRSKSGDAYPSVRTPEDTVLYENLIKMEFERQCGGERFRDDAMLELYVEAYYAIPKSATKKKRTGMLTGDIRPTKKPDWDNCGKVVSDALNGIAYKDDAQIVEAHIRKFYDAAPRIDVTISEI